MKTDAYLGIGTNLGDRESNILKCLRYIACLHETDITAVSRVYETEPVGPVQQDKFLNLTVAVSTPMSPMDLLDSIQCVESEMKRIRTMRWGPRVIDIDLLLYDRIILETDRLTIPHPRMTGRAFVLIPLNDIWSAEVTDYFTKPIESMIEDCPDRNGVVLYGEIVTMEDSCGCAIFSLKRNRGGYDD